MKDPNAPFPRSVTFAADTGVIPDATAHYQKRLSDLRGLFLDPEALERRIREENDPVCYENYGVSYSQAEGDIFFGTTIIYPGKVGLEYHLTRGHYHRKRNHAETYQALSGHGLVLFERADGMTRTAELAPGQGYVHRTFLGTPIHQHLGGALGVSLDVLDRGRSRLRRPGRHGHKASGG